MPPPAPVPDALQTAALRPGATVAALARHFNVEQQQMLAWLRRLRRPGLSSAPDPRLQDSAFRELLRELVFARNASIEVIAAGLQIPSSRLRTWLQELGLPNPRDASRSPQAQSALREQLHRLVREPNASMSSVAEQLEISPATLRVWLKELEVPTPTKAAIAAGTRPHKHSGRMEYIVAAYTQQGMTLQQIGEELGVTRERVRQILKRAGVTRADAVPLHRRGNLADIELLRSLVEQGLTAREIAARTNHGVLTVQRRLAELNLAPERTVWPLRCPVTHEELLALRAEGLSSREIGMKFSVSPPVVQRWLREAGVPGRPTVDVSQVQRLHRSGLSAGKIAALLGHSRAAIDRAILGRPSLAPHQREAAEEVFAMGGNLAEAAKRLSMNAEILRQACITDGIEVPRVAVSNEELLEWHHQGASLTELAARAGVAPATLYSRRTALLGGAPRTAPRRRSAHLHRATELAHTGLTVQEIAQQLDLTPARVRSLLRQAGTPARSHVWDNRRKRMQVRQDAGLPPRATDAEVFAAFSTGITPDRIRRVLPVGQRRAERLFQVWSGGRQQRARPRSLRITRRS